MRVLVTGANGFVGSYLVTELVRRGHEVFTADLNKLGAFKGYVEEFELNILDEQNLNEVLSEIKPEGIIHLAAQSNVKTSWEDPKNTLLVNTIGTINLLNIMKEITPSTKLITIGSSEEYGNTANLGKSLSEDLACVPQNPYALSKFTMGQVVLQIAKKDNLNVLHVRPFNHIGPGQRRGFVVSDFASQIASIEKGELPPIIKVGDLSPMRDFTDVRDVVEAYALLLDNKVENGIYNISSNIPIRISEILERLLEQSNVDITVQKDNARYRPSEVPIFIGSFDKLNKETGWKPKRNIQESLVETLNWWRENN